jgi:hypothetical protein
MASFKEMKKNRMANLESLSKQVEKLAEKPSYEDERIWKLERDKTGNGYAVIRFLPAKEGEDVPWQRIWTHGFKGPGGWYIENSLTTLGKDDPVSKANTALWNSGIDSDKNIARERRRKLNYYSNIYIVEDAANPDNVGKVFLFRYGKKIFEKITGVMNPEFADETPLNPFDLWEGSNFKMKMRQIDGFPNYDKSEFTDKCPLADDENKLEEIWKQQYSLTEVTEEKNFKNYAELEARFNTVIAHKGDEFVGNIEESTSEPVASTEKTDDTLDYFKKLAEQE